MDNLVAESKQLIKLLELMEKMK